MSLCKIIVIIILNNIIIIIIFIRIGHDIFYMICTLQLYQYSTWWCVHSGHVSILHDMYTTAVSVFYMMICTLWLCQYSTWYVQSSCHSILHDMYNPAASVRQSGYIAPCIIPTDTQERIYFPSHSLVGQGVTLNSLVSSLYNECIYMYKQHTIALFHCTFDFFPCRESN